ncbi:MAG TPA: DUF5681 domain-containing protein [Pseudobdellovibrionaceae bacterium]|nr:DUF5681 domain-containing protein [Pseudobdellovibrionaceae bacterium]
MAGRGGKRSTSFKPGQSGNPNGRPQVPVDIKHSRASNKIEFEAILNKYVRLNTDEINAAMRDNKKPMLEMVVAKVLAKAFNEGDTRRLEFILDRLIGTAPKDPGPEYPQTTQSNQQQKATFEQFCERAGYFIPFEKQLEMRAFAIDMDVTRLLLGSRGYGKTDFCTIMGVAYKQYCAWFDGLDLSEHTVLIITKSKSRNGAIIEEIGTALEKNGVPLAKGNASVIRVAGLVGQDHSVEAITIKTSMRGRHPKLILMDDPVTDEDVSEKMRETVKRRYDEAYKLCKNICIIGQPAHAHDLYAKLRDIVKTLLVPHGTIPQLDADLEAMKIAGVDEASIEMSYHLRVPVSGTAAFSKIKYLDHFPEKDAVAFIDPSDGGDFTAVSIVTQHFNGYAVVGFEWKMAWYHCLDNIAEAFKKYKVRKFCFETNMTGTHPLVQLREYFKPHQIGVAGKHSDSNKHACIMQAGTYAPMIHLSKQSGRDYTDHVVQYEYGAKFDDAPDSLARCLEWIGLIRGKS